jgi:hypothetical protein
MYSFQCLLTQGQIRLLPADRRGKSQAESQPEQCIVDKQVETFVAPNLNYQFFSSIFKLNENFEFTTAWYRQEAWQAGRNFEPCNHCGNYWKEDHFLERKNAKSKKGEAKFGLA